MSSVLESHTPLFPSCSFLLPLRPDLGKPIPLILHSSQTWGPLYDFLTASQSSDACTNTLHTRVMLMCAKECIYTFVRRWWSTTGYENICVQSHYSICSGNSCIVASTQRHYICTQTHRRVFKGYNRQFVHVQTSARMASGQQSDVYVWAFKSEQQPTSGLKKCSHLWRLVQKSWLWTKSEIKLRLWFKTTSE